MLLKQSPLMRPPALFAMGAVAVILLIYKFGNFREERLVQKFLEELKAGNFQQAYQTWGPTPGYAYKDFMADWGGTWLLWKDWRQPDSGIQDRRERRDRDGRIQSFEAPRRTLGRTANSDVGIFANRNIALKDEPWTEFSAHEHHPDCEDASWA